MTSLTVKQGDTWNLVLTWCNPIPNRTPLKPDLANPINIAGYTARIQIRTAPGTPGALLLALTSSPAAGVTVNGPAGTITVRASPAQTGALPAGVCYWECEITNGTDTYTLAAGPITVEEQVVM